MFIASRHRLRGAVDPLPLLSRLTPFHLIGMAAALALSLSDANAQTLKPADPATTHTATAPAWEVRLSDLRLDRALQRWAQEAGYSLRWDADRYLVIGANARYTGSLEEAVEAVLATPGIRASAYPLEACVYGNHPPLIRITRLGDQTDECL